MTTMTPYTMSSNNNNNDNNSKSVPEQTMLKLLRIHWTFFQHVPLTGVNQGSVLATN